jgi:hypothetical protein
LLGDLAGFLFKSRARYCGLLCHCLPGSGNLRFGIRPGLCDQFAAFVKGELPPLFQLMIDFGSCLTDGLFVLRQAGLILTRGSAGFSRRALRQRFTLVQNFAYGLEEDLIQDQNKENKQNKYDDERNVRLYDVVFACKQYERWYREQGVNSYNGFDRQSSHEN